MGEAVLLQHPDTNLEDVLLRILPELIAEAIVSKESQEPLLLNEKEAAEFFGLRPQTLALWRHQSKGPPYIKLGSSVRYEFKELKAFIHSQRVGR